jgi:hypothetical protein
LADNTWHAKSTTKPIAATIMGIADTLTDTGNFLLEAQKRLKPRFLLYREILKQIKKLALLSQLKKKSLLFRTNRVKYIFRNLTVKSLKLSSMNLFHSFTSVWANDIIIF